MKNIILMAVTLLAAGRANAYTFCGYEQRVKTILSRQIIGLDGSCVQRPLALATDERNGITVDIWSGGYKRGVTVDEAYQIDYFNSCGWYFGTQTGNEIVAIDDMFDVVNLNLIEATKHSYDIAPRMTNAEAAAAMDAQLKFCNDVKVGDYIGK